MTGSFSGVLRCHTSLPSNVSSWKLPELVPLRSLEPGETGLVLGLGGGAGGLTLVGFFGLGRVGGGCFLPRASGDTWSLTGSISGIDGSGGVGPWPLTPLFSLGGVDPDPELCNDKIKILPRNFIIKL